MKKFWKSVFGKGNTRPSNIRNEVMSDSDFLNTQEIKIFREKYEKDTIILNPKATNEEIGANLSKMGGVPNLKNFKLYPKCDSCGNHLNFIIQLYKKEYSDFYFPENNDLFQIFRCPNTECKSTYNMEYDLKMFSYYFEDKKEENSIKLPLFKKSEYLEIRIPECVLNPTKELDYPNFDDYEEYFDSIINKKYGEEWCDYMSDNLSAKFGTKYNGYPSWTQSPNRPMCNCGKEKEFFFQIASEEYEYDKEQKKWSDHGIMIGDLGNLYFFICKSCGENSIETTWDCY